DASTARRISRAARTARRAWSSCASGAPNSAMNPSPRNWLTVDFGERGLEELAQQRVHAVRADPLRQRGRAHHIAEQHRDRLALSLDGTSGGEDLLGEMARRV